MATRDDDVKQPIEARLARLARAADELAAAIRGRDDAALSRRPEPKAWSAKEIVCHLRDIEELCVLRYHAMLAMPEPRMFVVGVTARDPVAFGIIGGAPYPLDADRWAEERQYLRSDTGEALGAFRRRRDEALGLLRALTPEQWERGGLVPTGARSPAVRDRDDGRRLLPAARLARGQDALSPDRGAAHPHARALARADGPPGRGAGRRRPTRRRRHGSGRRGRRDGRRAAARVVLQPVRQRVVGHRSRAPGGSDQPARQAPGRAARDRAHRARASGVPARRAVSASAHRPAHQARGARAVHARGNGAGRALSRSRTARDGLREGGERGAARARAGA